MHTSASDLHPREVRSPVDTGIGIVRRAFGVRYAKFNDALLTGHPEVDAQHRALYSLVNDLNAQTVIGKGSREDVEVALERILRYAAEHFATEEGLMRRSGYPQLDEHIDVHRRFVQETTEMVAAHLEGHGSTIDELARFMEAWLEDHIDAQDRPLIAHLRAWAGS